MMETLQTVMAAPLLAQLKLSQTATAMVQALALFSVEMEMLISDLSSLLIPFSLPTLKNVMKE